MRAAEALGWVITHRDPEAGTLEATETSRIFRFVDDISVRVRADGDGDRDRRALEVAGRPRRPGRQREAASKRSGSTLTPGAE